MSRKDVTDEMVVLAYNMSWFSPKWPCDFLMEWTGESEKVCYRAMQRAVDHGLVEWGTSLRSGWLTEKGQELLKTAKKGDSPNSP